MAVILIIDDSPTELHLFQNMLEKNGFGTLVADSGVVSIVGAQPFSRYRVKSRCRVAIRR